MLFNSYAFIFCFLPLVLAVSLRLKGQPLLRWLTLSSFVFYAFAGHAWFLWPMLFTTCLDFVLAPRMHAQPSASKKKALLILSLTFNLGLLAYFKYAGLFLGIFSSKIFSVALPAGISFYTFQTMSYMIDVYRGAAQPELNFWKFAGFVSFFPHLVAGPLTRHHQLIPALSNVEAKGIAPRWEAGLFYLSVGLAKKILMGDRLALFTNRLLSDPSQMGAATAWLALLGFSLQIYFDFSGYSDMAIGIARLFDIQLPQNFNAPYQATDIREFWRRWHMTLSAWLRDYLYIPLGGNRKGPLRQDFNLLLTMFLGGLWHGASWNFALWGLYHGVLLGLHRRAEGIYAPWNRALKIALTFMLASLGWVFFRAATFSDALAWFKALAGLRGLRGGLYELYASDHRQLALQAGLGLLICMTLKDTAELETQPWLQRRWTWAALGLSFVLTISLLSKSGRFLYFQF